VPSPRCATAAWMYVPSPRCATAAWMYPAQGVLQQQGCTQPKVCYSSMDVPSPRCATAAWMYRDVPSPRRATAVWMYPAQGVLQQQGCTQPKVCYSSMKCNVTNPRLCSGMNSWYSMGSRCTTTLAYIQYIRMYTYVHLGSLYVQTHYHRT
jgi:hypothetical protein